ncbi:SDR family NAD(P)-dependent oxidoreductase [uncultured Martelella sp.]|uniref:SDR family NAD(P)-dependent oxidoreductase n=1 Tax=uncultured Martelella sp. TaxID=392331 RepID=UPI0029C94528|nr:SDR family NAD(P)-dependent oxidoreductase [uncultured Martelella sp.]
MSKMEMTSLAEGYHALVIGASGGIGRAFCETIADDRRCGGLDRLSRRDDGFEITDETAVAAAAAKLADTRFDLILCATGALHIDGVGPEKTIRAVDAGAMSNQFAVNAIGPALVMKHFLPLIARDRRTIFACLSARVGSIGDNHIGGWMSYRASKAALNQIIRTASIEARRKLPRLSLAALHPGTVATPLSEPFAAGNRRVEAGEAAGNMLSALNGIAEGETGLFLAYDGSRIEW